MCRIHAALAYGSIFKPVGAQRAVPLLLRLEFYGVGFFAGAGAAGLGAAGAAAAPLFSG
jgi:hypothetical protein